MDPVISPVNTAPAMAPERLLAEFRPRFHRLPWASTSPDTLLAPVWSPAESVARFEARIVALFTAHLKVLDAIHTGQPTGERWDDYVRPYQAIRAYCLDWPVIGGGEPIEPALLRAENAPKLLFGRPDVILSREGPRVVETNFDTAVGGYERPDDMWTLAAELFEPGDDLVGTGGPVQGLARYFVDLAAGNPLLLLWIMKNDEEVRQEYARLLARLERSEEGVRHRIYHPGDPVTLDSGDATALLHRACAIYTVNRDRERFATLLRQIAGRIRGCTVPVGLSHLDSKLFLAWLSDPHARPATLSAQEVDAVTALIPWTRLIKLLTPGEMDQVVRNRGDYILKKTDSYQSLDVFFGCNLAQDEWAALLAQKVSEPDVASGGLNVWIVQERVHPQEYRLAEYTDAGLVERRTGLSCCPYVLGGRVRGLETWVTPFTPHLNMIHRMQFVPHFIAPAAGSSAG